MVKRCRDIYDGRQFNGKQGRLTWILGNGSVSSGDVRRSKGELRTRALRMDVASRKATV